MSSNEETALVPPPPHWLDVTARRGGAPSPTGWRRDLHAIAGVMFADDTGSPDEARLDWLCERVDEFVSEVGGKGALAFRLSLFATSWLAPIWSFRLPKLHTRPFHKRVRILEKWERSPFGMSLFAIKAFATMHYFEHPDVAIETGFNPSPIGREEEE